MLILLIQSPLSTNLFDVCKIYAIIYKIWEVDEVKEWITKFNEKIDSLAASKWLNYLRITSGVVWNLALIFIVIFGS